MRAHGGSCGPTRSADGPGSVPPEYLGPLPEPLRKRDEILCGACGAMPTATEGADPCRPTRGAMIDDVQDRGCIALDPSAFPGRELAACPVEDLQIVGGRQCE